MTSSAPARWVISRIETKGRQGSISSGKAVASRQPSQCSTVAGAPAAAAGCRTTKPQRLVSKSASGTASASKRSEPSALPSMRAR